MIIGTPLFQRGDKEGDCEEGGEGGLGDDDVGGEGEEGEEEEVDESLGDMDGDDHDVCIFV